MVSNHTFYLIIFITAMHMNILATLHGMIFHVLVSYLYIYYTWKVFI